MPPDQRSANKIATLANIQQLIELRDEQSLLEAGNELAVSEARREKAQATANSARSALDDLARSSEFSPDELRLRHALLDTHDKVAKKAHSAADRDREVEQQARTTWHASRHQHDTLRTNLRSVEKYLSRKREERADSDQRVLRISLRRGEEL